MKHFLLTALLFIAMTGCGGKAITKDNFSKVKSGMTLDDVESILGKGTEQASSNAIFGGISIDFKSMVWKDENKIIPITFLHDKVHAKSQIGL